MKLKKITKVAIITSVLTILTTTIMEANIDKNIEKSIEKYGNAMTKNSEIFLKKETIKNIKNIREEIKYKYKEEDIFNETLIMSLYKRPIMDYEIEESINNIGNIDRIKEVLIKKYKKAYKLEKEIAEKELYKSNQEKFYPFKETELTNPESDKIVIELYIDKITESYNQKVDIVISEEFKKLILAINERLIEYKEYKKAFEEFKKNKEKPLKIMN